MIMTATLFQLYRGARCYIDSNTRHNIPIGTSRQTTLTKLNNEIYQMFLQSITVQQLTRYHWFSLEYTEEKSIYTLMLRCYARTDQMYNCSEL